MIMMNFISIFTDFEIECDLGENDYITFEGLYLSKKLRKKIKSILLVVCVHSAEWEEKEPREFNHFLWYLARI